MEESAARPVSLFPNHNVSGDTLGACLLFQSRVPISVISHRITSAHWVEGVPIQTLLALGEQHVNGVRASEGQAATQIAGRYLKASLIYATVHAV